MIEFSKEDVARARMQLIVAVVGLALTGSVAVYLIPEGIATYGLIALLYESVLAIPLFFMYRSGKKAKKILDAAAGSS